ncbi:MAG: response regulator transcription factor [Gammaproteobacteria bacterium]|nr:response regulator transcription factor [Gammaproteobacteria bacterium]
MKSNDSFPTKKANKSLANKKYLRILIVEDHLALAENILEFLGEDKYSLDFAYDGLTALHLVSVNQYDVIVLDIMLPGLSGLQICEKIRNDLQCHTPVLFVTARDSIDDKASGFSCGGDDYLSKPFDLLEMELRIQALAKRGTVNKDEKTAGSIHYNAGTLTVSLANGKQIELSGINAKMFEELMQAYPRFVTHESLSRAIWGVDDIDTHTVRSHIYNLRKTLDKTCCHSLIKTLRGHGYRLMPPEDE